MKQFQNYLFTIGLILLMHLSGYAQLVARPVPLWVSSKGYWVVESNLHSRSDALVRFYTNEHILIHTELLHDVKMNLKKPEVKIKLKQALELAVQQLSTTNRPKPAQDNISGILQ